MSQLFKTQAGTHERDHCALLQNIASFKRHLNGTRYIFSDMTPNMLHLTLTTGSKASNKLFLPHMACSPFSYLFPILSLQKPQFRVRVCFGKTTNKAHGQSFSGALELNSRKNVRKCVFLLTTVRRFSRATHPKLFQVFCSSFTLTRNVFYPGFLKN